MNESPERRRLIVRGVVQGVGFRPFVYNLAERCGLSGHVGNHSGGVFIEIEGRPAALEHFVQTLTAQPPPLARIESLVQESLLPLSEVGFRIVASQSADATGVFVPPDLCICDDCLRELFDPADRRYHYPFINCTHCGPRFTIIRSLPYDRAATTMREFEQCPACAAEYHDPRHRRFHAQPNACPDCGPQVWFEQRGSVDAGVRGEDALSAAQAALAAGAIVAVKGLGGFHLACDATDAAALARLRERKGRVDKPFAVMVRDVAAAERLAVVSADEARLLTSRERPIVLLRKRADSPLAEGVAPGNPQVGVMLPYTPLHYLLLGDRPLVMTSGNLSGEPIVTDNAVARERLGRLADAFLLHDRPIETPCDDSVIRVYEGQELPVRRSRGYAPLPVHLPRTAPPLLAVGGELKNTFCLTQGGQAFLSQHIGDMENYETLEAFTQAVEHVRRLYRVRLEQVVCDLHPGYHTSDWAARYAQAEGLPLLKVQHHHAHVAALMAEHQLDGCQPLIGVCYDGTGYGTDGVIWGGEVLIVDQDGFRRAAHLRPVPLPGGDAAIKRPYRAALAHLWAAGQAWDEDLPPVEACPQVERRVLLRQVETGLNCVPTTSMGRLFDAAAALIGLRQTVTYEAQAAMELEGLVGTEDCGTYAFDVQQDGEALVFDPAPVWAALLADGRNGATVAVRAARFHVAVADVTAQVCGRLRTETGCKRVGLTGGVFQNVALLAGTVQRLQAAGFTVYTHHLVPPNDGGLALGQAMVGTQRK